MKFCVGFVGWWFTHSGILQKWIYYRNTSVTSSMLRFQVYRPHCANVTSHLLPPGKKFYGAATITITGI